MANMYRKIDKNELIHDIKTRGSNVIISEWVENALELDRSNKSIYEIKQLFNELHKSEKNIDRVLAHLNMIFDKLADENIDQFLTSQYHIINKSNKI